MERTDSLGLTAAEGRKFGLTVGGAFLVLCGVLVWRGHTLFAIGVGSLGTLLVLAGLVIPRRLGPVESTWMAMAEAISKVTTPVLMSLIYFLVITPSGWAVRAFGHRPLERDDDGETYWVERSSPAGDLERQF